ncbi:MAG: hypothetical protein GY816_17380 [Cytophagales bacterium]|nr:hypothetical protein [Cytophagales bacterium]
MFQLRINILSINQNDPLIDLRIVNIENLKSWYNIIIVTGIHSMAPEHKMRHQSTNILTDEALQSLKRLLEDDPLLSTKTQLSDTTTINLLKFICDHTTFTYQQQPYHQIRGLPMGGRLSAFLASICMNSFDYNINLQLPPQSLYVRYMDDILVYTSAEPQKIP